MYLELAKKMALLIDKGVYKAGDKLPSLRSIHQENNISIGTVLQAFHHLQDTGLVVAREKSGYFVNYPSRQPLALPQPAPASLSEQTVRIDNLLQKLRKEKPGKHFISFANALPDHRLLPFNGIKRTIQQISRDTSGDYLALEDAAGNRLLREALARRSFTWGGALHADEILVTNGATEAINLCLKAITQPGDTVLIQDPCYYGVMQSLEFLGLKAVAIPCHAETGIELRDLEEACSKLPVKACLLVSNFNNPTGASLSSEKKKKIAAFAARHKIPVIEDDLYGDLYLGHGRPDTIKTYDKNGWVLLCNSFSKSLFPGFRIGWCAPGRFGYEVTRFKKMNNVATASFSQRVLQELLHTGIYDRHLQQFRKLLQQNLLRTSSLVERHFPKGTRMTRPKGGIVLWIELPKRINAVQLQDAAFEQGIGIAPGEIFSAQNGYKHYIRLSFCNLWDAKTEKALAKLGALCSSFC